MLTGICSAAMSSECTSLTKSIKYSIKCTMSLKWGVFNESCSKPEISGETFLKVSKLCTTILVVFQFPQCSSQIFKISPRKKSNHWCILARFFTMYDKLWRTSWSNVLNNILCTICKTRSSVTMDKRSAFLCFLLLSIALLSAKTKYWNKSNLSDFYIFE